MQFGRLSFRWLALPLCALVLGLGLHLGSPSAEAHSLHQRPYAWAYVTTAYGVYQYDYYLDGRVVAHLVPPGVILP
jgi:hypothetical protein